jgi:hypothetical protein
MSVIEGTPVNINIYRYIYPLYQERLADPFMPAFDQLLIRALVFLRKTDTNARRVNT